MFFYEDVLALPSSSEQSDQATAEELEQRQIDEDLATVCAAEERNLADRRLGCSSTQALLHVVTIDFNITPSGVY